MILIFALKYQVWYQSRVHVYAPLFSSDLLFVYGGWYQLNPYLCSWPFNVVCWSVREAVTFCGMRHSTRLQLWGIWGQFRNSWEQIAPFLSNRVEMSKYNHYHTIMWNLINDPHFEVLLLQFWSSKFESMITQLEHFWPKPTLNHWLLGPRSLKTKKDYPWLSTRVTTEDVTKR